MRDSTRWIGGLVAVALTVTACGGAEDAPAAADPGTDRTEAPEDETNTAATADGSPVQEHDTAQPRLVVADAASSAVVFVDLGSGQPIGDLTLDGEILTHGASLTADGRYLLAPHPDGVSIVDGGSWSERHGDHAHHYTTDPAVLGRVEGPDPSHLVSASGLSALYFDGTGEAILLDEDDLAEGAVEAFRTIETGEPHHGFAVPAGDDLIVTVPTADMGDLPAVVGVADGAGTVREHFPCAETHGEASLPDGAAAACTDGVLLVRSGDDGWDAAEVPYPDVDDVDPYGYDAPRAWTLTAPGGVDWLAAALGTRHVLRVDVEEATATAVEMDADVALFGVEADDGGNLLVLTTDGAVQRVDPENGTVLDRTDAIAAFEEGDTSEPFRRLVRSGGHAYVSDPASRTVVELALDDLTVARTIDLPFAPGFLDVIGGT